jgi:SAM-dependent methyltransferase
MTCTCCGDVVTPTRYRDELLGEPLVLCATCHHVQVSTLPSPDVLAKYYASKYSQQRSGYVDRAYLAVMAKRAVAQCDFIERAGVSLAGLRVADVGCGYGALLEELTKRGAIAIGYEYDPACVEHCTSRGLRVERIESESDLAKLESLDLVTLSHTLEHMRTVDDTLELLRARARHLFIEVPRYSFDLAEQFRDQEGHLHFFTPDSLARLLQRAQVSTSALTACGPDLHIYWRERLAPVRRIWRALVRDWFFNAYAVERESGMWIRAIAATRAP